MANLTDFLPDFNSKDKPNDLNRIVQGLNGGNGANQMFRRLFKTSIYTDGFKAFMDIAKAQWIYDIIETEVLRVTRSLTPDVHYLTVKSGDNKGQLILRDYKGNVLWSKNIDYTDLPIGQTRFKVGWNGAQQTTCLISED